jgi:SAM-dependent methyltransferase
MTSEALYDAVYFRRMRNDGKLYTRFLSTADIDTYRDKRVLDVGCGCGNLIAELLKGGCRDVTGFDFSQVAVEEARRTIGGPPAGTRLDIKHGSVAARELFAAKWFDLAFMTDVVEHLPPDVLDAGLSNVRHWLKPAGGLVVHTFPTLGPHRLYQRLLKLQGKHRALAELDAIHCNVQTRSSLRTALERAGFKVERLWIRNDFTLTSSAFKALHPGAMKTLLGSFLDNVLGSAPVQAAFGEYAAPSIYAIARA